MRERIDNMTDFIETDLLPLPIKKHMEIRRKVGACMAAGFLAFGAMLWLIGAFQDAATGLFVTAALLLIGLLPVVPIYRFQKLSQSRVRLTEDRILVLDRHGVCWRTIDYSAVTDVRAEKIGGFFYGSNSDTVIYEYICVFLNGVTELPKPSFQFFHSYYADMFQDANFLMFAYHADAYHRLCEKTR